MLTLTLVSDKNDDPISYDMIEALTPIVRATKIDWLEEGHAVDLLGIPTQEELKPLITEKLVRESVDWCLQPEAGRRKQLLISDMDSTIIGQECIDEIADMMGLKSEVSAITERAMQGELDFAASLKARVALLKDLPETALHEVWRERIHLNEGAETLVRTMRANGAFTLLVSGGFTFFTELVAERAGFDGHHANQLEIVNGKLTGQVYPPILDKDAKKRYLLSALEVRNIPVAGSLAVGDGANDLEMIKTAGLGIAYYAKPVVNEQAGAAIRHTDLTTLLYFQGYRKHQFASHVAI